MIRSGGESGPSAELNEAEDLFRHASRPILITGGAGFIGTNVADRLLRLGCSVVLVDNLSRGGVDDNALWLRRAHRNGVRLKVVDVRNEAAVAIAVREAERVFHFAAQVAVTTSLTDPIEDFEVNARGTLNVLEAIRKCGRPIPMLFTSTNKVYGALDRLALRSTDRRYEPTDPDVIRHGVAESELDFHSPYGCSKGAADQYVLDYARTFAMPATVFRMSCIYGPHQMGTEDQGWVAHFLIRAMNGEPITIFGDGKQVRDLLFVGDLVDAMLLAHRRMDRCAGRAFNIGGGPGQAVSLIEVIESIERLIGRSVELNHEAWRPADQRWYVSDTRRFEGATRWGPRVGVAQGLGRLHEWLSAAQASKLSAAQRS